MFRSRLIPFFLFPLLFILSTCVKNPVTGKHEVHMISETAEMRLGEESKNEIIKEYGLYQNPAIQAYINSVGQKIVAVCERKNIHYDFVVLDTTLVNAFAVPGVVFLTRGILDLIDDEAELAAVIGHEVGHITNYHSVKIIQKSYGYGFLATFAAVAGTIYAPTFSDARSYAAYYDTLYRGIGLVTAGFLNGYGREFEREADRSGLRYAVLAGYDPDAMISFFKRMDSLGDDSGISVFMRSHPPNKERIERVQKELANAEDDSKKGRKKPATQTQAKMDEILRSSSTKLVDHFEKYQEIVKSVPKKEEEPSGTIQDRIYTNPTWGFKLQVPQGWKLEASYGKALVNFTSQDRKAQGELKAIKLQPDPTLFADPKSTVAGVSESTQIITSAAWAQSMEEGMHLQKRTGREVTYPAGPAFVGTYRGHDRMGRPAFFKILFIVRGEKRGRQQGYLLTCAAPDESYLDYLLDFEKIMESLAWLSKDPPK